MRPPRRCSACRKEAISVNRPRATLAFALALAALACAAPAAHAATTTVSNGVLTFTAAPGESNHVALSAASGVYTLSDPSVPVTPGPGCAAAAADRATCPASGVSAIAIDTGDGNDTIVVTGSVAATIADGAGDDTVTGGSGSDTIVAGPGTDSYSGGAGNDTFIDAAGASKDVFNGGSGTDRVSYAGRQAPVTLSLDDVANDGAAGEQDNVRSDVEQLEGGDGSDAITGNASANRLLGGSGDDTLDGGAGDDQLDGGPGDDWLRGMAGADTMSGGTGQDTVDYGDRTVPVSVSEDGVANDGASGEGDNVGTDVDDIVGGSANDTLTGSSWGQTIDGGAGNDVLSGRGGNDTLLGGPGNDTLNGDDNDDTLDGGAGADRMNGGNGTDTADYSARSAPVTVTVADTAHGDGEPGEGDDVAADVERVAGGSADDTLTGDARNNTLIGGGGDDTLDGGLGDDSLQGGAGADQLTGGSGRDTLDAGTGDDRLDGGPGADQLTGGDGTDTLDYSARTADLTVDEDGSPDDGEAGEHDNAHGDIEVVLGGSGDDRLTGGAGDNRLVGGPGDDVLRGGAGADVLEGGGGSDTADYSDRSGPVSVTLGGGADDGEAGEGDDVAADVENATGGSAGDRLVGDGAANALDGGGGSDLIAGGAGDDELAGGDGDDVLQGGAGADAISGGAGSDTLDFSDSTQPVSVDLSANADSDADRFGNDVENATGGAGDDRLIGGVGPNVLSGGPGDDVLDGRDGADTLAGGPGTDRADYSARTAAVRVTLDGSADDGQAGERDDVLPDVEDVAGGAGDDTLTGSAAANALSGGAGRDRLDGRGGDDTLSGGAGDDTLLGGAGRDRFDAGPGSDFVQSRDGHREVVACGRGSDGARADRHDTLSSCESDGKPDPGRSSGSTSPTPPRPPAPTLHVRDLRVLALRSNFARGGVPHVRSHVATVRPCSGSRPLVRTWKAAARSFGLSWKVLAGITQVESGLGCNMGPSSAGAVGWTQFMPATWRAWGMDADADGRASPYDSVDAIFSTARYLRASGAPRNYRHAIYAYNHAAWYVDLVLRTSRQFKSAASAVAADPRPLALTQARRVQTVTPGGPDGPR